MNLLWMPRQRRTLLLERAAWARLPHSTPTLRPAAVRTVFLVGLVALLAGVMPVDATAAGPLFDEHPLNADADSASIGFLRPPSRPPLPMRQPQLGPEIKRAYMDDIELRTTAFVPQPGEYMPDFAVPDEERWIRVDLGEQVVVAYERDRPVRAFMVSTGLPDTPTVIGEFRIRTKVRSQTMSGGSEELGTYYSLPNVQWVQYFFGDYGFHGSYWHNNFGQPMSHGCVNMTNADARWLFEWAGPEWNGNQWMNSTESNQGTFVIVHE